jgi:hypothetical protein
MYTLLLSNLLILAGLYIPCAASLAAAPYNPEPSFSFVSGFLFVKSPQWKQQRFQSIAAQRGSYISTYDWCMTPASNLLVVWEETLQDNTDSDIYALLYRPDGGLVWRTPVNRFRGKQKNPKAVALPDNSVMIVWQSDSAGAQNNNIWAQRILHNGLPLWKTPVPVCAYTGNQVHPALALDLDGSVIVAWEDFRDGHADIYGQRIELDGSPVGPEDGVSIEAAPGDQKDIQFMYSSGKKATSIMWNDYSSGLATPVQVEIDIERIPIPEPGSLFFLAFLIFFGLRRKKLSVAGYQFKGDG